MVPCRWKLPSDWWLPPWRRCGSTTVQDSPRSWQHPDLAVIGTACDGMAAIKMAAHLLPDLVLMDLDMPVVDGVLATREILRRTPCVRVLAFTGYADEAMIKAALQAGACGCASKWDGCDDLLDVIRRAMPARHDPPPAPHVKRGKSRGRGQLDLWATPPDEGQPS